MTEPTITIEIKGIEKILAGLRKFPEEIKRNLQSASAESAKEIVQTPGLGVYPPQTEANQPGRYSLKTHQKMGYYVRGAGAVTSSGKQLMSSEKYGTKFYVKREGFGAVIGNSTSYAKYLAGEKTQARVMEKYGWRKLIDVAREKTSKITTIFEKWVDKTIKTLGL